MVPHPLQVCCPAERHDEVVAVLRAAHLDGLAPRLDDAPGAPAEPTGAPPRVLAELVPEAVAEVEPDLYLWAGAAERLRLLSDLRATFGPSRAQPARISGRDQRALEDLVEALSGGERRVLLRAALARRTPPSADPAPPDPPQAAALCAALVGSGAVDDALLDHILALQPARSAPVDALRRALWQAPPPEAAIPDPGPGAPPPSRTHSPTGGLVRPLGLTLALLLALALLSWGRAARGARCPIDDAGPAADAPTAQPDASIRRSQPSTSGAGTADGQPSGSLSRS